MKTNENNTLRFILILFCGVVVLIVTALAWDSGFSAPDAPDQGGYNYTFGFIAYDWIDATDGSLITFEDEDDDAFGPVALGFDFAFFENTYSEFYISTNGVISFAEPVFENVNSTIPHEPVPNNLIAVLWEDLILKGDEVPTGEVYTKTITSAQKGAGMVVEWNQAVRFGEPGDNYTFQVILYENGDICYQYNALNGDLDSVTVGFEDADGVSGESYIFNGQGSTLTDGLGFCYRRPVNSARSKIVPAYQSGFVIKQSATFDMDVSNIGDLGNDTFDLSFTTSAPGWEAMFYDTTGSLLSDTNGNNIPDTGSLAFQHAKTIRVEITSPENAQEGNYSSISVFATSTNQPSVTASSQVQTAVPVKFGVAYADSGIGIGTRLQLFWEEKQKSVLVGGTFTGSTMSMAPMPEGEIAYAWEQNAISSQNALITNIEYVILTRSGEFRVPRVRLTDHSDATNITRDRTPSIASLSNGRLGIAFTSEVVRPVSGGTGDSQTERKSNLYFRVIDNDGDGVSPLIDVTKNTEYRGEGDENVPDYSEPRIADVGSNFMIAAVDNRLQQGQETNDIRILIYDQEGTNVLTSTVVADGTPGGIGYLSPSLTSLNDAQAFLAYSISGIVSDTLFIEYQIIKANGDVALRNTISNAKGEGVDAVQLLSGNMLVSWLDQDTESVAYVILDGETYNIVEGPVVLPSPDKRTASSISVMSESQGRGIISWRDSEEGRYLYYALVDDTGNIITPPMRFLASSEALSSIQTSGNGGGVVPYQLSELFLPVVFR